MKNAYITKLSRYLPNKSIQNDEMESYLGYINDVKSRSRSIILRNNGIKSRHYAINENGEFTHTNAQLAYEAVKKN